MRKHDQRADEVRAARDAATSDRAEGSSTEPEDEADQRYLEEIGYQPSVNQVKHEPMPASEHDERDQLAVQRNAEIAAGHAMTESAAERDAKTGRPRRR
jgi:hypothetical protein